MAWAGRELAIAHGPQLPAQGLLGDGDAEFLEDPLCQIDQPPTHDTVDCRDRTVVDHVGNRLALGIIELRGLAGRFAVQEAVRATRIEPQHPIPDDLKPDTTDFCCLAARRPLINRSS
jgi:hypothetical protein